MAIPATTPKSGADTAAPVTPELVDFTVAKGRTVTTDDGDVGPGGTVSLSAKDGARLQKLGFLLDNDGTVTISDNGPPVVQGVEIKEQA